ncbi:hypothetical protein [Gordonia sp. NPDC127522]|uniref:hypothetical protein n=1 Tax=Gordonia sp. NPDC127522 TaxID=3345390 RepID=UPI00363035FF
MNRSVVKKMSVVAATMGAAAVLSVVGSPGASANSFSTSTHGGTASYDDGGDRFCAFAWNTEGVRTVRVTLTAISRPGPSHDFTERNTYAGGSAGNTCRSLATAYEDTQYRAVIRGYWGEPGTTQTKTVTFYS